MVEMLIHRLDKDLPMPQYAKPGDAGMDIYSRIDLTVQPGERALVPTGLAVALPGGYAAFVHPRSGLAIKNGISLVNTPGTVDAAYRGEIAVIIINHDLLEPFQIHRGDRIAQLVIQKVETPKLIEVEFLPGTDRGAGGFGSTGVNQ
jgi:dUTP pyrophosphatase